MRTVKLSRFIAALLLVSGLSMSTSAWASQQKQVSGCGIQLLDAPANDCSSDDDALDVPEPGLLGLLGLGLAGVAIARRRR